MDAHHLFWAEFLEIYKSLPVLWNVKSENYSNRVEKAAAYDKLVDKLEEIDPQANREKVIKKINSIRTSYRRELNKIKRAERAGDFDVSQTTLWYFDKLHFLTDQHEEDSKAKSTASDNDSVSDLSGEVFETPVKRKKLKEDEILKTRCRKLKGSNDATSALREGWESEYVDVKMDAHKVFWSEFLGMYKSLPVLWKVKNENSCNWMEKAAAYDKLVTKLKEIDPEANKGKVIKKINIFRTNYRRELKKMQKAETCGSGTDNVFHSTLWYFDQLHFLTNQHGEHSKAKNTMIDDECVNGESNEVLEEEILKLAYDKLKESSDATLALAKTWASQYAELENKQRVLARTMWADVLFHGCMNRLTEKMVEDIHQVLKGTSNISTAKPRSLQSSKTYYKKYS